MYKFDLSSIKNTVLLSKPSRANYVLLMVLFVCVFSNGAIAQTNTWDGSSDRNWNNTANWDLNTVPTSSHDVVIPKVAKDPIIYSSTAVAKSVTINSKSKLTLDPDNSSAKLSINGNFINNGIFEAESGTINISGSWTNNDNFKSGTSTINFVGTSPQTINGILDGNKGTFYNLTFNGIGGSWTLDPIGFLWISNKLTLTNGIVNTTSIVDVDNKATGSIAGGSSTSFINGRIKRSLNSGIFTYHFPVGRGTTYLPFSLVNSTGTGSNIKAIVQAFDSNSGGTANFTTIGSLSTTEYWSLTTENITNSGVSLSRPSPITPFDAIAGSETAAGTYNSLGGTENTNGITVSSLIGTNRFFTFGKKNAIRTGAISGSPLCAGASVSVPFTASGSYPSGNVFTAQLSDASGSFASPVNIGSIPQTTPRTIVATVPPATGTGTGYRIRVVSSNPTAIGQDNGSNLTINNIAVPIVGTKTHPDCVTTTGSVVLSGLPASGTIYQTGTVVTSYPITGTTMTVSGLEEGTYKFAASNGTCTSSATENVVINAIVTNTWTAKGWSQGTAPTADQKIIFAAEYSSTENITACSCIVTSGTVTFNSTHTLTLTNELKVTAGTLNFNDKSSLVQINDSAINSGNITYKRTTSSVLPSDYTYWSSPVANQNLNISPSYVSGMFYSYNDFAVPEDWQPETASTTMQIGKGYIIRGPQVLGTPPPGLYDAIFVGVPNNGIKNIAIGPTGTSNLIGNPYPSAIDADMLLATNSTLVEGTIYFWTHNTAIQLASNLSTEDAGSGTLAYTADDYASYNGTGGVAASDGIVPTGKIAAGQAFFTTSTSIGASVKFNNKMRLSGTTLIDNTGINQQFFKTKNPKEKLINVIEKNRVWLNLTNSKGAFKQTLIGYVSDATNDYDSRFDGESFDGQEFIDFYSVNQDKNLTIQGRALPFDENDEVPLGFRSTIEGPYTISIDQVDGSMTNQAVFIEDKLTNAVFDLKEGNYTFNTVAGTFNERFVLRYTNKTLGTNDLAAQLNKVLISIKNKQIEINSFTETIDKVTIYDVLGRQIYQKNNINSNEFLITNLISSHQTLIVKTSLQSGNTVTEKVIY